MAKDTSTCSSSFSSNPKSSASFYCSPSSSSFCILCFSSNFFNFLCLFDYFWFGFYLFFIVDLIIYLNLWYLFDLSLIWSFKYFFSWKNLFQEYLKLMFLENQYMNFSSSHQLCTPTIAFIFLFLYIAVIFRTFIFTINRKMIIRKAFVETLN